MKKLLFFVGIVLILTSCATKTIHFDQLQERNGLFYLVNDNEPFNGEIVSYSAGKVEFEGEVRNGLMEGLWIYYYPNGQKQAEGLYKDGLKEGTWTYWAINGEQENQEVYKMGTQLGTKLQETETSGEPASEGLSGEITSPGTATPSASATQETKEVQEPKKPKPVNWDHLTGGPIKYYKGTPYTGPFVKYYKEGNRGVYLEGSFTNGHRSGKWTYYFRDGKVKDIKYY